MEICCEPSLLATLETKARAAVPAEACGLIAGHRNRGGWRFTEFIEMTNQSARLGRFSIDPVTFVRIKARIESKGQELGAIFHSHPRGHASLSASDLRGAWPELVMVICSPAEGCGTEFAAWRVSLGRARRVPILTQRS